MRVWRPLNKIRITAPVICGDGEFIKVGCVFRVHNSVGLHSRGAYKTSAKLYTQPQDFYEIRIIENGLRLRAHRLADFSNLPIDVRFATNDSIEPCTIQRDGG